MSMSSTKINKKPTEPPSGMHATLTIENTGLILNLKVLELNLNISQVQEQLRQFGLVHKDK